MNKRRAFPLLAKVLAWLVLHLVILGLAFLVFRALAVGPGSGFAAQRIRR